MKTEEYRECQFDRLGPERDDVIPSIKIIRSTIDNQETNWMNVTEQEIALIRSILTGKPINQKERYLSMAGDLPYKADNKHVYLASFSYDEHRKAANFLAEQFLEFYNTNQPKEEK